MEILPKYRTTIAQWRSNRIESHLEGTHAGVVSPVICRSLSHYARTQNPSCAVQHRFIAASTAAPR
jgi:hypothetical protein